MARRISTATFARLARLSWRFEILRLLGSFLVPEYRFSLPQMTWWQDDAFEDYLRRVDELEGVATDRRWMLYQLLRLSSRVSGDTAECGVYKGAGSFLVCRFAGQNSLNRCHHVFDSFEGLSRPSKNDGTYWREGDMAYALEAVKANLTEFDEVVYYPGWIPDRFDEIADRDFSFVHVDVDLYRPTLACMEFFYPRLNQGGVLLCDDYGFTSCPGATEAIDRFLRDKPEGMIALPCGGGFLIKGSEVRGALAPSR